MTASSSAGGAACPFCAIASTEGLAREVMRTGETVAFFPLQPATPGHTLVIPRRHVPDIWSVEPSTAFSLAEVTLQVAHAVRRALNPPGLNIIQSNGEVATQTIRHVHVHVVPRWTDDDMGPIWPVGRSVSQEAASDALLRIRAALQIEG